MPSYPSSPRLRRGIEITTWALAVAGHFGPWIAHTSAALAWNAFDLFDILRVLPEIETLALPVNLYALRLPIVGLAVLLPLLLLETRSLWRWGGAALGALLVVNTLPPYSVIWTAWRTPGWRVPFWWGVGALLALLTFAALGARWRNSQQRPWVMLAWLMLTGLPAFITFPRLLPALERLYAASVNPGWGFWVCGSGFLILALSLWLRGVQTTATPQQKEIPPMSISEIPTPQPADAYTLELNRVRTVKERYERDLLAKANVVGVGIGLLLEDANEPERPAVIVNVTQKVPLSALAPADRIPEELEGVPVKVQAIGQPIAHTRTKAKGRRLSKH